ncbi:MAG: FkbM family methyltransferase [Thermoanaerobaculia bacterium]
MESLFTPAEVADLEARALPRPTAGVDTLADLDGAVLLGAGVYSGMLLPHLRRRGIRPAWFADSAPERWGSSLCGIEIRPPESLAAAGDRLVVAMTHHFRAMAEILLRWRVQRWAWFTQVREVFGNYDFVARPDEVAGNAEITRLARLLHRSAGSLEVLKKSLLCRVSGDPRDFPPATPGQYFQDDLVGRDRCSRFVDCGAFTGDTLREWAHRVEGLPSSGLTYHALEPDPENFRVLEEARAGLAESIRTSVHLHGCAAGREAGHLRIVPGGLTSLVSERLREGVEVPVVRLDDLLPGESVTALKMDVEGFEPHALEGARTLISTSRPVLLVAIYHQVRHLWELPLWIHDLGLGYRVELRHHDRSMSETVCYALPEGA